jgi:hypothetical protein
VSKLVIYFSCEELHHPFALLTVKFTPQVAQNFWARAHFGGKLGGNSRTRGEYKEQECTGMPEDTCQSLQMKFRRNERNLSEIGPSNARGLLARPKSRLAAITIRLEAAVQATDTKGDKQKGRGERKCKLNNCWYDDWNDLIYIAVIHKIET